mmetsp:Transcript_96010/g.151209  ORF Transcript_96010/g.151209 Transcript_96010/m.151209 type:complete len:87 (-) Transcript_96010:14-274(-)
MGDRHHVAKAAAGSAKAKPWGLAAGSLCWEEQEPPEAAAKVCVITFSPLLTIALAPPAWRNNRPRERLDARLNITGLEAKANYAGQ